MCGWVFLYISQWQFNPRYCNCVSWYSLLLAFTFLFYPRYGVRVKRSEFEAYVSSARSVSVMYEWRFISSVVSMVWCLTTETTLHVTSPEGLFIKIKKFHRPCMCILTLFLDLLQGTNEPRKYVNAVRKYGMFVAMKSEYFIRRKTHRTTMRKSGCTCRLPLL